MFDKSPKLYQGGKDVIENPYFNIKVNSDAEDFDLQDTFLTTIFLALLTDARILDTEIPPDGSDDRRGWFGDELLDLETGSRAWAVSERAKMLPEEIEEIRGTYSEALDRQIIQEGLADSFTINYTTNSSQINWEIDIFIDNTNSVTLSWISLWDGSLVEVK